MEDAQQTTILRRVSLIVALVAAATAAVGIPARTTHNAQVSIDEPQYLMPASSLGEAFDLDVSDEIAEKRYLALHEVGLNTQTIDLNEDGQRISPHRRSAARGSGASRGHWRADSLAG